MILFKPGDIVYNSYQSENNPYSHLMYIGSCIISQGRYKHNGLEFLHFDGTKAQFFRQDQEKDNFLILCGHLDEYDNFKKALKGLQKYND